MRNSPQASIEMPMVHTRRYSTRRREVAPVGKQACRTLVFS
jgi:hypothetical protein